jgi:hypothetical protein
MGFHSNVSSINGRKIVTNETDVFLNRSNVAHMITERPPGDCLTNR